MQSTMAVTFYYTLIKKQTNIQSKPPVIIR
jgi:hypothetical protein